LFIAIVIGTVIRPAVAWLHGGTAPDSRSRAYLSRAARPAHRLRPTAIPADRRARYDDCCRSAGYYQKLQV